MMPERCWSNGLLMIIVASSRSHASFHVTAVTIAVINLCIDGFYISFLMYFGDTTRGVTSWNPAGLNTRDVPHRVFPHLKNYTIYTEREVIWHVLQVKIWSWISNLAHKLFWVYPCSVSAIPSVVVAVQRLNTTPGSFSLLFERSSGLGDGSQIGRTGVRGSGLLFLRYSNQTGRDICVRLSLTLSGTCPPTLACRHFRVWFFSTHTFTSNHGSKKMLKIVNVQK